MTWSVKQGIEEAIGFIEQYVFSVLDVCDKLLEEKKIAAGGPVGGAIALSLIHI